MKNLANLSIFLSLNSRAFENGVKRVKSNFESLSDQAKYTSNILYSEFNKTNKSLQNMNKQSNMLFRYAFVSNIGRVITEGIKLSDTYGQYSSRLRNAVDTQEEFINIQKQLVDVSNMTYKSYKDANELFIRANKSLKELGYSALDTANLVSTIQFGLTVDSADAQKTQSVINSFTKSILTGRMQMEEFNSIISYSPSLFQAMADSISGGSQKELRKLVGEGKLTADQILKITSQMDNLGVRVKDMPTTLEDAIVKLKNNFSSYAIEVNNSYSVTNKFVKVIDKLGENIDIVGRGTAIIGTGLGLNYLNEKRKDYFNKYIQFLEGEHQSASFGFKHAERSYERFKGKEEEIKHLESVAIAREKLTKTTKQLNFANTKLGKVQMLLGSAVNFVGGPLNALTIAIGVGTMAWQYFSRNAEKAKKILAEISGPIDEVKQKLENMSMFRRGQTIEKMEDEAERIKNELNAEINNLIGGVAGNVYFTKASKNIQNQILKMFEIEPETRAEFEKQYKDLFMFLQNVEIVKGQKIYNQDQLKVIQNSISQLQSVYEKYFEINEKIKVANNIKSIKGDNVKYINPITSAGMQKWDEYIKKLQKAKDVIGLNTRELAEYKAVQEGANKWQSKLAGVLAEQEESYKSLYKAAQEGDIAKVESTKNQIRLLDIEQQKLQLVAAHIQNITSILNTTTLPTAIRDSLLQLNNTVFAHKIGNLQASEETEKAIKRVYGSGVATPTGRGGKSRAGGGAPVNSELINHIKQLKEQVVMLDMSEVEQDKYKISLMKGSQALKDQAVALTLTIARHKEEAETLSQTQALYAEIEAFRSEKYSEILGQGLGNQQRQIMSELASITKEVESKRRELLNAQSVPSTRLSDSAFNARLNAYIYEEEQKLAITREYYDRMEQLQGSWKLGAKEALANIATESKNVYDQMSSAVSNAFSNMEDALMTFVSTGKFSFKDFANSIISDLTRIIIKQSVIAPLASGVGNLLGGLFGAGKGWAGVSATPRLGFAAGGYTGYGGKYQIAGIVHKGEGVLSQDDIKRLGGVRAFEALRRGLRGYASGGLVGTNPPSLPAFRRPQQDVTVNVNNQSSSPVTGNAKVNYDQMGNMIVDVMLKDLHTNGRYAQQLKVAV